MGPKVLVTGAAGFIGFAVVQELLRKQVPVVALDALLDGLYPAQEKIARLEILRAHPLVTTVTSDLRSADLGDLPSDITHVVNEAAMPGLGLSWEDFNLYSSCNTLAVSRLIDVARTWPLEKFVHISTSSVYGKKAVGNEDQALRPVSPYGITKLAGENLVLAHFEDSGFPATVLRYFSVYGPGQRPDMAYRRFIHAALHGEAITLRGSGEQSRSNTFVDDVAAATVTALFSSTEGEVFNISGGEERTINEALGIIEELVGHPLEITRVESARGDQMRTAGDSAKARDILGLKNSVNLEEGLAQQLAWQQNLGA